MKRIAIFALVLLMAVTQLLALEGFERQMTIPIPEKELNNGGVGNMISGEDIDGDGNLEIYLVNDNWGDGATEVIPRIYKLENSGSGWEVVWNAKLDPFYQNTWPCLSIGDLDDDGKKELIWGPVNSTSVSQNPDRLVVYEHAGDDAFGVDDGSGNYSPNSSWTIVSEDDANMRPMDWAIKDIDDDGVDEIYFADRKGYYYFGVISVDDIPDDGAGTETWTLEMSGEDFELELNSNIQNKWAVASIGSNFYAFCEAEIAKLSYDGTEWSYTSLSPMAGGSANQSAVVADLDNDGTEEIIAGIYDWGDDDHKAIMLLQEDGDSLLHTPLVNVGDYFVAGERGLWGVDHGDIDGDGYLDFIFGSRGGVSNGQIFRFSYKGGVVTDPGSYEFTVIDSVFVDEDGIWSVVNVANLDDDPELEVLYTSSASYGGALGTPDTSAPVIVLDYTDGWAGQEELDNLIIAPEVLMGDTIPDLFFKPGKILNGGNTIWFVGVNGDTKESFVFRSINGGQTFTYNETAIAGRAAQMDAFDADIALVSTANGKIYKTSDGGATFTEVYSYSLGLGEGWFNGMRVINSTSAIAFGDEASDGNMHFVKTTDKGDNWTELTGIDFLGAAYGYYTWGLGMCNVGESVWIAGTSSAYEGGYIFRSYDAGENWDSFEIPATLLDDTYVRSVAFIDDNKGMVTTRRGDLLKTTDGGENWSKVTLHSNGAWVNGVVAIPNSNMFVALDDNGAFYTDDMGQTWGQMDTPSETDSDYFTAGVFESDSYGYVFTYNGQVLRFENQETSAIDDNHNINIVGEYILHQNYPNPFNPSTKIAFNIPRTDNIKLVIYDILGHKINTLVNAKMNAGHYTIEWNGRNNNGKLVSTGIYLYQLQTPNLIKTRKMTYIK